MRDYCTQSNGDCSTCSLVNYGRDCQNNKLMTFKCDCGKEWKEACDFGTFFADVDYSEIYRSECPECAARNLDEIAEEDNGAYLEAQAELEVNHCIGAKSKDGFDKDGFDKDDFLEMIRDWQADHSPETDGLVIQDPEIDEETGEWIAYASDEKCVYMLSDDGTGNIRIHYGGTK